MSMAEQMDRFGLNADEAAELRRALVGVSAPPKPPAERWNRPEKAPEIPRKGQRRAPQAQGPQQESPDKAD